MSAISFLQVDGSRGLEAACKDLLEQVGAMDMPPKFIWVSGAQILPTVAHHYASGAQQEALKAFEQFKETWFALSQRLLTREHTEQLQQVRDLFTEVEWLLYDAPMLSAAYYHDQIVPIEALVLSRLISLLLQEREIAHQWYDARDLIRTNDTFGNAQIDLDQTASMWHTLKNEAATILLQAGIGASDENETTQWNVAADSLMTLMEL